MRRGRPRVPRPDGPTPQTAAKLRPDLLRRLVFGDVIDDEQAAAGRAILDAWEIITGPVDIRRGSGNGHSEHDSPHAERLQAIWRCWARELASRVGEYPGTIVDWIRGDRPWDTTAGATMSAALAWWLAAARQVAV